MKSLFLCRTPFGLSSLVKMYSIDSSAVQLRLAGAGYRVLARLNSPGGRWGRIQCVLSKPDSGCPLAFEFWLGGGIPLNPYLIGRLRDRLLQEVKPKELRLPNWEGEDSGSFSEDYIELLERTTLRSWTKEWLRWVSWYATVACDPNTRLRALLEFPLIETYWKRRGSNQTALIRYGLSWKLYDWARKGKDRKDLILPLYPISSDDTELIDGSKGTDSVAESG